jgi:hypothetical protein
MSQHFCTTTMGSKAVEVLMGWDRPLQGFFMVIHDLEAPVEDDGLIYSNLDEPDSHPQVLDPFTEKLEELGIQVPAAMIEEVKDDQMWNVGNKMRRHEMQAA